MEEIPDKMLAWPLFGAGMEKLGKNDQPCLFPVPEINDDELLVRIDAIGLCFSDIKLIRAGEAHPRVVSENLSSDPVIPGHEAVMTIVKVGDTLSEEFKIGQRFIIQADIYVNGKGFAYGYAINGGMAQYSRINQKILNGDEGCYLLPIMEETPAGIAALIEPWTCVIASYMIEHRSVPTESGNILIAGEKESSVIYQPGDEFIQSNPEKISFYNLNDNARAEICKFFPNIKTEILETLPEEQQYDDIFLCDISKSTGEQLAKLGKPNAIISFIGNYTDEEWAFDIGNIHYKQWFYQGDPGSNLSAAYRNNHRHKIKPGGTCWLPGGAGAMGQMHTQLAVESADGPARILVTDLDNDRINNVISQLSEKIKRRNIEFKSLNPNDFPSPEAFEEEVYKFSPEGFDDIIMLVPVIPVLNSAVKFLKKDGLMNIFAGIPAGKEGSLNIRDIVEKGIRLIGSSGSRTHHLRHTLSLVESNKLNPATALAAIGGMKDLKKGLQAVADATFPGKTVIFPNCEDMPLTTIDSIEKLDSRFPATLSTDGGYCLETEKLLMKLFSGS